jgi:uncharacterized protein (DUF1684 family)
MSVEIVEAYIQEIEEWRRRREDALRAADGWLSLVGLFMLAEGEYILGSSQENDIVLPVGTPELLGVMRYSSARATLEVKSESPVLVDNLPVWSAEMVDNGEGGRPTVVKVGSVSFNLHRFGDEVALRVRDSASPAIQEFGGCNWYAVKSEYKVLGKLERQSAPTPIAVPTSVKTVAQYPSIGVVTFELLGQSLKLLASPASKPDELFIILRDPTAGRDTYGAGRYLYAPVDEGGTVTLDFNKAYFPPCAFTPYATCSLPPAENVLHVAIEAGERY